MLFPDPMTIARILPFFLLLFSLSVTAQKKENIDSLKGLKDHYRNYFPIGVAISPQSTRGPEADMILKHFSSLTAENVMKIGPIHPLEDQFNWQPADEIVNFAATNGLRLRGHTLCWHNQTPPWLFKDSIGNPVTREILLARLKAHITQVVTRYKGKIFAWDVVNEAIDDDSAKFLRASPWYTICGEEYIAKAFEFAHEADPDALLFYNDYNTETPAKREKIYRLVKKLKDANVPIHGIGLQGHWSISQPSEKELRASIEKFASLGLTLHITELDVSVYPSEHGRRERKPDEPDAFTQTMEQQQVDQYAMLFKVLRDYKKFISSVTFWNVSDRHSWLDNFPVRGRKNYPLLFDQKLKPKRAYWKVVKF